MTTDIPYAADAEMSLSFDELEVRLVLVRHRCPAQVRVSGLEEAVREGGFGRTCHRAIQVQLCLGAGEEPTTRPSS